jgi:general stress protein 26
MAEQIDRVAGIKKIGQLINDIDIAMMTTVDEDGTLRSRPMSTQKTEFDGTLWFFTESDSPKVDDIRREYDVNLSYARPDKQQYVSVSGKAALVRDRAKMQELWNPSLKAWFPDGLDQANLGLLRVDVQQAQYWDSPGGLIATTIGLIKALATGESAEVGENKQVKL